MRYFILWSMLCCWIQTAVLVAQGRAPIAPILAKTDTFHGEAITDPYAGMRNRHDPKVKRYLQQENRFTAQQMRATHSLQKELVGELKRWVVDQDSSFPHFYNGYWYCNRYTAGADHPHFYRKKGSLSAPDELLLDVGALLKQHKAYNISSLSLSWDNEWMGYFVDRTGNFENTIYFKDLTPQQRQIPEQLHRATGLVWSKDPKIVYYSVQDSVTNRSYAVYRHQLGTDPKQDELIYEETDKEFEVDISASKSGEYLFICAEASDENETWYLLLSDINARPRCMAARQTNHLYYPEHLNNQFYILSNYQQAVNNQLFSAPVTQTGINDWRVLIPHRHDVYLSSVEILGNYIATEENRRGDYQVYIYDLQGKNAHLVSLPGVSARESGVYYLSINEAPAADTLRFSYKSLRQPTILCSYHIPEQKVVRLWERRYPHYNPDDYICERVWATAADGKQVPTTLLYHKNTRRDTTHPCLLEAYGSYGAASPPTFYSWIFSLVDRGWVYGIAHVRGGDDLGKDWYLEGKLLNKKNTFNDFIACTEHLIQEGYTSPSQMAATGASAGGLLMGAIINQRPDLYQAVILGVPFVDVMNTMLDPDLPLTVLEYNEWGNPNDKVYYDYMRSYSPYDNVKAQDYPHLLFLTGIADEQVGYWEPTKMVAKLRQTKTNPNRLLLLQVNMAAGHGGNIGRYSALGEIAFSWAFFIHALSLD